MTINQFPTAEPKRRLCFVNVSLHYLANRNDQRNGHFLKINCHNCLVLFSMELFRDKKVQVGKDQEKAQSEKDSHSKNRGGKKPN